MMVVKRFWQSPWAKISLRVNVVCHWRSIRGHSDSPRKFDPQKGRKRSDRGRPVAHTYVKPRQNLIRTRGRGTDLGRLVERDWILQNPRCAWGGLENLWGDLGTPKYTPLTYVCVVSGEDDERESGTVDQGVPWLFNSRRDNPQNTTLTDFTPLKLVHCTVVWVPLLVELTQYTVRTHTHIVLRLTIWHYDKEIPSFFNYISFCLFLYKFRVLGKTDSTRIHTLRRTLEFVSSPYPIILFRPEPRPHTQYTLSFSPLFEWPLSRSVTPDWVFTDDNLLGMLRSVYVLLSTLSLLLLSYCLTGLSRNTRVRDPISFPFIGDLPFPTSD